MWGCQRMELQLRQELAVESGSVTWMGGCASCPHAACLGEGHRGAVPW
jgi:hypothetical protein